MIYPFIALTQVVEIAEIQTQQINSTKSSEQFITPASRVEPINHQLFTNTNTKHSPVIPEKNQTETSNDVSQKIRENSQELKVIPMGINVGETNVIESTLIRGFEDGKQAINFDNWLIPFDDVMQALKITATTLEDGQLELRSVGLVTRINPKELKVDSELGLVLSVADIQKVLGVPTKFNIVAYAIEFNPPWLDSKRLNKKGDFNEELPVNIEGLPKVNPPVFSFSSIGQSINITGNNGNINQLGDLTAIGTLLGGSWYVRTNQPNLSDRTTWKLSEAQYLRQTDSADYVVGSQPTFWQSQGTGQYWGFTNVQRFGYTPPNTFSGGFSPSQRMQSSQVGRTISGKAAPGTLVQLTRGFGNNVVGEVLVDSSGVYRFENVPTGSVGNQINNNYRVRLYANGQLTTTPEIREANFSNLPGQLTKGTSALIISSGFGQEQNANSLIGNFTDLRGGVAYRAGLTEDLTVGTGVIYDKSLLGLGEFFYQPKGFPLQVVFSGLIGTEKGFQYNAEINFRPFPNLDFNFDSDRLTQRFRVNWQALSGIGFRATGNTLEKTLAAGINISRSNRNFSTFVSADIDTNNNFRWSLYSRLGNLQFSNQGNEIATNSELSYYFSNAYSSGNSLSLGYETRNGSRQDNLAKLAWNYCSDYKTQDGRNLWEFNLGYGVGSRGSGLIASASTAIIPGLNLRLFYEGISTFSNNDSFRIELSPSFNIQPRLTPSDSRLDRLRSEGGLLIQPFLDKNGNGRLDQNEKVYTEDADILLTVNNKPIKLLLADVTKNGVFVKLAPDNYRLDLDPAGYPVDWKPTQSAYAVEVVAGGYTSVLLPFTPSYTVAGALTDAEGKPIGGARVEAVPKDKGKKVLSVTNGAGVFFLENLQQGTYNLLLNGKPAQPDTITIDTNSESIQEVNLKQ